MRFQVARASSRDDNIPPCPDAVKDDDDWWVTIDDLAALVAFMAEQGSIIIRPEQSYENQVSKRMIHLPPHLTIYDYYVE